MMNRKKKMCLMFFLTFTVSTSLAFAAAPSTAPTHKTTLGKLHNQVGVLIEPDECPKIAPKVKTNARSETTKTPQKQHNKAGVLIEPTAEKIAPKGRK